MKHIVGLKNTVSQVNPVGKIIEGSVGDFLESLTFDNPAFPL